MQTLLVPTPKRTAEHSEWYAYYAGYSEAFVRAALATCSLARSATIVDPWNGAGTTTLVASASGYRAYGYDLNPVMVEVARGRVMPICQRGAVEDAAHRAVRAASRSAAVPADPLSVWFGPRTCGSLRAISNVITSVESNTVRGFLRTALMRVASAQTRRFISANPTWVKAAEGRRIALPARVVGELFASTVKAQLERDTADWVPCSTVPPTLVAADAASVPLPDAFADAIVTSPPYCTRIDYARKTAVELATLGASAGDVALLRDRLTGTTSIRSSISGCANLGPRCQELLDAVRSHPSKSSANYYLKTFAQYFADLAEAIREANRYLKHGARAVFVVQDSWYKEVHVDLASLLAEMAARVGWRLLGRQDFPVRRTIRSVNTRSRAYRPDATTHETALSFLKP